MVTRLMHITLSVSYTQGRTKQIVLYGCSHTNLLLITNYIRSGPFLFNNHRRIYILFIIHRRDG